MQKKIAFNRYRPLLIGAVSFIGVLGIGLWIARQHLKKQRFQTALFDSPDLEGSGRCMDPQLLLLLYRLEQHSGYPVRKHINSGARSPSWNAKVGGVSNSSHQIPKCQGVDIGVVDITWRNRLIWSAKAVGFKRIGVGRTFIHLDIDPTKSQYVAWGYPKGTPAEVNPFRV